MKLAHPPSIDFGDVGGDANVIVAAPHLALHVFQTVRPFQAGPIGVVVLVRTNGLAHNHLPRRWVVKDAFGAGDGHVIAQLKELSHVAIARAGRS